MVVQWDLDRVTLVGVEVAFVPWSRDPSKLLPKYAPETTGSDVCDTNEVPL